MDKAFAIFDMDGTLVDSMDYWRGLAREYLARQGLAPSPELLERIKPMTMTQSAEHLQMSSTKRLSISRPLSVCVTSGWNRTA